MNTISTANLKTPCFILDEQELKRSVNGFRDALQSRFEQCMIGYSVKTNSLPYALIKAKELGCIAEVVSHDEYQLARLCGFPPHLIIYNGPMKSKTSFLEAVQGGAIVNVEAKRELEWLRELPTDRRHNVGLRLNINISHVSPEDADGTDDDSRFGFSDDTSEFADALSTIVQLSHVRLAGLHIHRTAHSRSPRFYRQSIDYACQVVRKYGLKIDYLDVGGGYFGFFPNKPTYQDYADTFHEALSAHGLQHLRIIVEPGNALVASCFSFLSEVIDVKHVSTHKWFVSTDGSRNDIDPFFRKSSYMTDLLTDATGKAVAEQVVSGCTCLEYDRLFSITEHPLLNVGDRIRYKNVGAYTMCLSPLFIRFLPRVYAIDELGG